MMFVTFNRHQLAGQVANLDFWLAQVRHALAAIDGYGVRFVRMEAAQERYVAAHGTTEFIQNADERIERKASPPRRIPDRELRKARRALTRPGCGVNDCEQECFCGRWGPLRYFRHDGCPGPQRRRAAAFGEGERQGTENPCICRPGAHK
jgi:hypothetical protein